MLIFSRICVLRQRNYRSFYVFIFSMTLLCLYIHGYCWVYIKGIQVSEEISIWEAMKKTPVSIALIVYSLISGVYVGILTIFHTYLISTNQVWTPFNWFSFLVLFVLHLMFLLPLMSRLRMKRLDTGLIHKSLITKGSLRISKKCSSLRFLHPKSISGLKFQFLKNYQNMAMLLIWAGCFIQRASIDKLLPLKRTPCGSKVAKT